MFVKYIVIANHIYLPYYTLYYFHSTILVVASSNVTNTVHSHILALVLDTSTTTTITSLYTASNIANIGRVQWLYSVVLSSGYM